MTFTTRILIGFSVAATLGMSSAVAQVAGDPAEISKEQKRLEAKKAEKEAAAKVFVDPLTGQIRQPTAAEIGALAGTKAETPQVTPATIAGPGGGVGVVLDESTMMYSVATKGPDGKLELGCVTGEKAAANLLANPKPVTVKPVATAPKKEKLDVQ